VISNICGLAKLDRVSGWEHPGSIGIALPRLPSKDGVTEREKLAVTGRLREAVEGRLMFTCVIVYLVDAALLRIWRPYRLRALRLTPLRDRQQKNAAQLTAHTQCTRESTAAGPRVTAPFTTAFLFLVLMLEAVITGGS
jgi:hypothetical protein